jgi:hypothetical protein
VLQSAQIVELLS